MIQHQVELDLDTQLVQILQIPGTDEFFVYVVINDGKTPIQVAVEKGRQDIEQRECVLQLGPFEQVHRVSQSFPDAVRVGVQHYSPGQYLCFGLWIPIHDLSSLLPRKP